MRIRWVNLHFVCQSGVKSIYFDFENGVKKNTVIDFGLEEYTASSLEEFIEDVNKKVIFLNTFTFSKTIALLESLEKNKIKIDVIFIDSLKAIQSEYVNENLEDIENLPVALSARNLGNFLNYLKNYITKNECLGIFINQLRMKFMSFGAYLDEMQSSSFLYTMDVRTLMKKSKRGDITISYTNSFKEEVEKKIGHWVELRFVKSRIGNAYNVVEIPIIFGKGVSLVYLYIEILKSNGIINFERINSKIDLTKLKELCDIDCVENEIKGFNNLVNFVSNYFNKIEKYILDNNLIYIGEVENNDNEIEENESVNIEDK